MIRLYLSGGLGNQMFQYATARSLSLDTGQKLIVDNYLFSKKSQSTKRNYELSIFNIDQKPNSSLSEKILLKGYRALTPASKVQDAYAHLFNIYSDKRLKEINSSMELNSSVRLFGYFQNEKYFLKHASTIREDFIFKDILSDRNKELSKLIETSNSVSIHIRRGDYLASNSTLSIIPISHYIEAIDYIKSIINNPSFFIFSDDISWVKENLNLDKSPATYIDWNIGNDSYMDMQLMSLCKHNIIANSSFSWWAAWLNQHNDKTVIVPSIWYKAGGKNNFEEGFIPSSWTIL